MDAVYNERVSYIEANLAASELLRFIDYRAKPSPTSNDFHWRWMGDRSTPGVGKRRIELVIAEVIGQPIPWGSESWCADETDGWPCLNPSHAIGVGSLPMATDEELGSGSGFEDGPAPIQGFQVIQQRMDQTAANALSALDTPLAPDFSDPATRFLMDHGYDAYGQPLKRERKT
jgi:hypothetical protein